MSEELNELLQRHPLPWSYMPDEHDDWGDVRDGNGRLVVRTCTNGLAKDFSDANPEYDESRKLGPPQARLLAEILIDAVGNSTRVTELEAELDRVKEELDATECSHQDEEAAHAETLRMLDVAKAEIERLKKPKMFPLQRASRLYPRAAAPLSIPWSVAEMAYGVYAARYGTDQSLQRLAERGGFGVEEMDEFYPPWRDEVSELTTLRANREADLAAIELALANMVSMGDSSQNDMKVREALAARIGNEVK